MKLEKVTTHFPPFRFTRKEVAQEWASANRITWDQRSALLSAIEQGNDSVTHRVDTNVSRCGPAMHRDYAFSLCCEASVKIFAGERLDNVIVCTSSGMLIPGLAGAVAEAYRNVHPVKTLNIVGAGCGAFFDVLQVLPAFPGTTLVLFVEVQSALQSFPADTSRLIVGSFSSDAAAACIFSNHGTYSVNNLKSELSETGYCFDGEKPVFNAGGELKPLPGNVVGDFYCAASSDFVLNKLVSQFSHLNFDTANAILRNYGNCGSVGVLLALQQAIEDGSGKFTLGSWGAGKNSICTFTHES